MLTIKVKIMLHIVKERNVTLGRKSKNGQSWMEVKIKNDDVFKNDFEKNWPFGEWLVMTLYRSQKCN